MNRTRSSLLPIGLVLLASLWGNGLNAQDGTIVGQAVRATSLAPLGQVQVYLQGTPYGALSAENGRFLVLNVPPGTHTLRAERIGFETVSQQVTITPGQRVEVTLQMTEAVLGLDEIIVTGTAGAARRREVGNSVTQIDLTTVEERPVSLDAALQGSVPGMQVMQSSAQVGSAGAIRLRGDVSLGLSNQPLVYIDGVRVRSNPYPKTTTAAEPDNRSNNDVLSPLNDINPSDIARIEVIKGAAATTLYGTEAAAGVIQIFTKTGTGGAARWALDVDQGFSQMRPFAPDPQPYFYLEPWLKRGHKQTYNLSVSGGQTGVDYFVSGQYGDEKGVLPNDQQKRRALRTNLGLSPVNGLNIQWNSYLARISTTNTPTGNNSHGLLLNVYRQEFNYVLSKDPALISEVLQYDIRQDVDRMNSGLTTTFTPNSNFETRLTVGYDLAHNEGVNYRPFGFKQQPEGTLGVKRFRETITSFDFVQTVRFGVAGLRSTLAAGAQSVVNQRNVVDGYSRGFPGPGDPTLSSGAVKLTAEERVRTLTGGFFVQNLFDLKDRYFLTVGARIDGHSVFGSNFGWQAYPKVSGSYVVSDEAFWPSALGTLKLRAAYGQSGRAPEAFDASRVWNPVGWGDRIAFFPANRGNPELGPERTSEIEVGFDGAFLDQRVKVEVTRYSRRTEDALLDVPGVPSEGPWGNQRENVGTLASDGLELVVSGTVLDRRSYSLDLGASVATNHSEVVSVDANVGTTVRVGQPIRVIRGTKIVNAWDVATPELVTNYDFGPALPTHTFQLHVDAGFPAGIRLSARGEYQGGHFRTDGAANGLQTRGIPVNPFCLNVNAYELIKQGKKNTLPAVYQVRCDITAPVAGTYVYPANFFKLRDVTLSAPAPEGLIPGVRRATVSVSARNWYRWLNKDFATFDPEMTANDGAAGVANGQMNEQIPPPASVNVAFRFQF
jgi:TonB-dependent SusC/RagA subfamily outer membrane receptor